MASGGGYDVASPDRIPTPPLPEGCLPLEHQVAGHFHGRGKTKAGMLQCKDNTLLKPVQPPPRGDQEKKFFSDVFRVGQDDPDLIAMQRFLPKYLGVFKSPQNPDISYLKLEDTTRRFHKPCILDVKMGLQVYEKGTPLDKVELARKKYPPLDKVGFQLLGMRIYHPSIDEYVFYDKTYGRSLDEDGVIEGLARYLNSDEELRSDVIPAFIKKLEELLDWFETQTKYHFFSSSLLFVYEGEVVSSSSDEEDDREDAYARYGSNIVSYSELEMKDSDARESKLGRARAPLLLPRPPGKNRGAPVSVTTVSMATSKGREQNGEKLSNGPNDTEEGATGYSKNKSSQEKLAIQELNGNSQKDYRGLTVAEMRAKQEKKLGPPTVTSPLAANKDSDWSVPGPCDSHPPISNSDLTMQACALEPANPITCTINEDLVDVRMIDFAHVIRSDVKDESYMFGLKRLIQHFKTLNICGFEY